MRDIEPRARNHLDIDAWARPHHPTSAAKPQRGPHKQALSLNTALVASVGGRGLRLPRLSDLIAQHMNRDPEHEHQPPEPWVTKRQLADHLSVTPRGVAGFAPIRLRSPRGRLDATYLSRIGPRHDLSRSGDQINNRGGRIRTGDLSAPNRARYQASPRPASDLSLLPLQTRTIHSSPQSRPEISSRRCGPAGRPSGSAGRGPPTDCRSAGP